MRYEDVEKSTVAIQQELNGHCSHIGNGFFISHVDKVYLVTCDHVISRCLQNDRGPISLYLGSRTREDRDSVRHQVTFGRDKAHIPKLKDAEYVKIDVVAIEFDEYVLSDFPIIPWKLDADKFGLNNSDPLPDYSEIFVLTSPIRASCVSTVTETVKAQYRYSPPNFDLECGVTNPFYEGASGSLVFRRVGDAVAEHPEILPEDEIEALGIFGGSLDRPSDIAQYGYYRPIDIATEIIRAWDSKENNRFLFFGCEKYEAS